MRRYIIVAAVSIPLLVVVFLAAGYVSDEVIGEPTVSRGVTAAGLELSRLTVDEATSVVAAYEASLADDNLTVIIEGEEVELPPSATGFAIDEDAVVAQAMAVRRSDGLLTNIGRWFGTFTSTVEIEIPTTVAEESVTVELEDDGPGIDPVILPRIFDRFFSAGSTDRPEAAGSGLGLAIAREIVEAHGGRIWAESDGGTVIRFTLPRLADGQRT